MKTAQSLDRLHSVLARKVEAVKTRDAPRLFGLQVIGVGVVGAALGLIVLKGAAIAQGDLALASTTGWTDMILGADPISLGVAQAFGPSGPQI